VRSSALKGKFGITLDEYNALLVKQKHTCAVCHKPDQTKTGQSRRLAVDHNHETGKVRGLLCFRCNLELGFFEDKARLTRLVAYLESHKESACSA
jgi:hypothetical protein